LSQIPKKREEHINNTTRIV